MTTLTENISVLRAHLSTAEKELALLQSGRKASSARARKSLQNIKQLSHLLRKEVVEHVKSIPTKKRAPSKAVPEQAVLSEPEPEPAVAVVAKPAKKAAAAKPTGEQPKKKAITNKRQKEQPVP